MFRRDTRNNANQPLAGTKSETYPKVQANTKPSAAKSMARLWLVVPCTIAACKGLRFLVPAKISPLRRAKELVVGPPKEMVKTLWFEDRVAVVLFSADRVDESALSRVLGRRLRLAKRSVAASLSGYAMGELPPYPLLTTSVTIVDSRVAAETRPVIVSSKEAAVRNGSELVRLVSKYNSGETAVYDVSEKEAAPIRVDARGGATQFACVVHFKRKMAKTLCFLSVEPAADNAYWQPLGLPVTRIQLICGKSLERRVGKRGLERVIKRIKVGSRLLVQAEPQWSHMTRWRAWLSSKGRSELRERRRQRRNGQLDLRCISLEVLPPSRETEAALRAKNKRLASPNLPSPKLALDDGVRIRVLDSNRALEDFISQKLLSLSYRRELIVGLDAEWEPGSQSAALVQLAVDDEVLILDLTKNMFDLTWLEQCTVVGFGIDNDISKVRASGAPIRLDRIVELKRQPQQSLSSLARDVLGASLDKSLQCSPWGSLRPLTQPMIEYAALDARVLLLIHATTTKHTAVADIDALDTCGRPRATVGNVMPCVGKDAALAALAGLDDDRPIIDYNRRAGVVKLRDCDVVFVNWPSGPKYPNVLRRSCDGVLQLTWWPPLSDAQAFQVRLERLERPCFLFARLDRQPFVFCGRLQFKNKLLDDRHGLLLTLRDTDALLDRPKPAVSRLLKHAIADDSQLLLSGSTTGLSSEDSGGESKANVADAEELDAAGTKERG